MTAPRIETLAEGVTLYLGDCREILPTLPKKADVVITDPPYIGLEGGLTHAHSNIAEVRSATVTVGDLWGASTEWMLPAWNACERGMVVFCTYHAVDIYKNAIPGAKALGLVTWHKSNAPRAVRNVPRATTELIWLLQKEPGLNWRALDTGMVDFPGLTAGCVSTGERLTEPNGKATHPAQKPLDLMRWLMGIGPASVLDPFMGTGTTGAAAVSRGREFTGIEISPKYFEIACRRIDDALRTPDMFIEKPKPVVQEKML